jgi:hypothetical protein
MAPITGCSCTEREQAADGMQELRDATAALQLWDKTTDTITHALLERVRESSSCRWEGKRNALSYNIR